MSISPYRLKKGKQYIIKHHDTGKIYKGTFDFMTSIMVIMKNGDKKIIEVKPKTYCLVPINQIASSKPSIPGQPKKPLEINLIKILLEGL